MLNKEINDLLHIEDKTVLMPGQESLEEKVENLKKSISQLRYKTFLVDDSRTNAFTTHNLEFNIPGTSSKMAMEFKDANGEFYESKSSYDTHGGAPVSKAQIVEAVKEADVYVIAIDTTYLMEAVNPHNELCNESVNMAYNHVGDIHSYLTNIDDKEGADAKLVLFVPIKCEKWAHSGQIDKVTARVKEVYKKVFVALSNYKNVKVDIIPVETVGAIEFEEHREAYICSTPQYTARKCCVLEDEELLRFGNGELRPIKSDDIINEDPEARISEFHSIIRPYSWFHVTSDKYSPANCEQLAFYILQFVLAKYLFIKQIEEQKKAEKNSGKSFWRLVRTAIIAYFSWPIALVYFVGSKMLEKLGTVSLDELKKLIVTIESRGLIKKNKDGICNVQESLLNL